MPNEAVKSPQTMNTLVRLLAIAASSSGLIGGFVTSELIAGGSPIAQASSSNLGTEGHFRGETGVGGFFLGAKLAPKLWIPFVILANGAEMRESGLDKISWLDELS